MHVLEAHWQRGFRVMGLSGRALPKTFMLIIMQLEKAKYSLRKRGSERIEFFS